MIENLNSFLRDNAYKEIDTDDPLVKKQLNKIESKARKNYKKQIKEITKIAPTNVLRIDLNKLTIPVFDYLFNPNYYATREMYIFGSRKSAKTKHTALRIIMRIITDKDYNALAMRKVAAELNTSVKEELQWAINLLGLNHYFQYKIQAREFVYRPTGQKILLKGISINPTSGKPSLSGLTISVGFIKDCWLEEAWEFAEDDYKMIRQTLRGGIYTLLIIGNPYYLSIWAVRKAVDLLPPKLEVLKEKGQMWKFIRKSKGQLETIVHWVNFLVNTKLHKADIEERWAEEKDNPKDFIVTGYGMYGSPSGTILGDLTHHIQYITFEQFVGRLKEPCGGVDVGLVHDATAATFGGWDNEYNSMSCGEYFHSNGTREANQFSDNGVWRKKEPDELAKDVVEFYLMFKSVWEKHGMLKIPVDHADRAFINILNKTTEQLNENENMKFIPTIGKQQSKRTISTRIIWERQILSHHKLFIVKIDEVSTMTRLEYEFNNIPWKKVSNTGEAIMERDGSKVHPDMTNAWEYGIRKRMDKATRKGSLYA